MPRAALMTTGKLAAALQRAVLAVDPGAAERRKQRAEKDARVEAWAEPGMPLARYPAGTWGPSEANQLIEREGRHWRTP